MGSYAEAIDTFENNRAADDACRAQLMATEGRDVSTGPVIECHRAQGRLKGGAAVNFEQKIVGTLLAFGRAGWNDGRNETFAYTEVDNTLVLGAAITGASWRRPGDRTGVAFVSNGLSHLHAEYLRQGGKGFLLGDGRLNYARETITEAYYTVDFGHGSAIAADVQVIANPGYNHDRGPVVVGAIRLHQDL
jgi:carbohydrate-selective porin OprB